MIKDAEDCQNSHSKNETAHPILPHFDTLLKCLEIGNSYETFYEVAPYDKLLVSFLKSDSIGQSAEILDDQAQEFIDKLENHS